MSTPRVLVIDPLHPDAHARLAAWADVSLLPDGLSRVNTPMVNANAVAGCVLARFRRIAGNSLLSTPACMLAIALAAMLMRGERPTDIVNPGVFVEPSAAGA
ncbi:MAG: hypothetical protein JWQ03_1924 [Variovorax sp.]|nr:hypothetical protein [Variovorax sp.]